MKVYAQHGHQPSDKITRGLTEKVIDGVIFSSRCLSPEKAGEKLREVVRISNQADVFFDPEFFASRQYGTSNAQLGQLDKWGYLRSFRRRDLVRSEVVEDVLDLVFKSVRHLPVTALVAPNIYISQSFDSMEAGIALNFIERSKASFRDDRREVYATLAIDRRALLNKFDFISYLNDLTALENRPDGFYVLIGGGSITERSDSAQNEMMDANVIGGWMLLNYALSQNGFKVINGFADLLTPFLAAVGAQGSATGWWSNLRTFSMGRYLKADGGGGQLPIIRYFSKLLLNRIKKDELSFATLVPGILNGLPHDADYQGNPDRTTEAIQTWEALSSLTRDVVRQNTEESLQALSRRILNASDAYSRLSSYGISGGYETVTEYLNQLDGGISTFRQLAEL